MLPILIDHDKSKKPIGFVEDNIFTLLIPLPRDTLFDIFGYCGMSIIESELGEDNILYITKGEILEYSISPSMKSLKNINLQDYA